MKRLFIVAFHLFISLPSLFAQDIPSDSILLRTIYGNVNHHGKSVTKNHDDYGQLTFKISFKGYVRTDSQNILLVVCRAPVFYQFGHRFGFTHYYYLNQLNVIQSYDESDISPVGDSDQMELMELGKNRHALTTTFQSTGNHHYERNVELKLIGNQEIKSIGTIDLDYSNEAWIESEEKSSELKCTVSSYEGTIEINETGKEWFTINVARKTKIFNEACLEVGEKTELFVYQNEGGRYQLIK